VIEAACLPVHADALAMSQRDGRTPLDHALFDGEDFELCLTLGPEDAARLLQKNVQGVQLHRVGWIVEPPGLWLRTEQGTLKSIPPRGFDHLSAQP
jgi:thiamine-monophosphate kinase